MMNRSSLELRSKILPVECWNSFLKKPWCRRRHLTNRSSAPSNGREVSNCSEPAAVSGRCQTSSRQAVRETAQAKLANGILFCVIE